MPQLKILYAASEAAPLVKTGGLGDVAGSLPLALRGAGCDVRLILPAYRAALKGAGPRVSLATLEVGAYGSARLLQGVFPASNITLWLVDVPHLFDREGGPYSDPSGQDWPDNAERFAVFARVVAAIGRGEVEVGWRPDVVHCNDWQTGLVPALLAQHRERPATVFTIHNLAYQGLFPAATYDLLRQKVGLPDGLFTMHALEFHGRLSFMKGGLAYADMLSTVSPTYANEICEARLGYGLEGLLNYRRSRLQGILNGMDTTLWDPRTDPFLSRAFSAQDLSGKAANKQAVQQYFGLDMDPSVPLIGMVGRLVEQKGGDLMLDVLPRLAQHHRFQLAVLGTGDARIEKAFKDAVRALPRQVGVEVGFSEKLAHLIEAGADLFVMPSRFEPCGLNQMYSLRYGTVPVVHRTGGLADTVVDASPANLSSDQATGFVFDSPTADALEHALERALILFRDRARWQRIMRRGMREDFSWQRSAQAYCALYEEALARRDAGNIIP